MARYLLKLNKELHGKLKAKARANGLSVSKLLSGAAIAMAQDDPETPLIVGSSDTLIGAKTKRLDYTYPKA